MEGVNEILDNFLNSFGNYRFLWLLFFFTVAIVVYSVFVYYFYKFLAKKNIIDLNLNQYNKSEHVFFTKFFAFIFYVIEYVILLPALTLFWFGVLSLFLLLMAKNLEVSVILTISAALIASVRITSYVSENLSRDLAKMLPFTLLALSLTTPNFFSINLFLERLTQMPSLIKSIPYYILFIVVIELIMRAVDLIRKLFNFERRVESEKQVIERS